MSRFYGSLFDVIDLMFDPNPTNQKYRKYWSYPNSYTLNKTDDDHVFTVDLPGHSKEDVKVTFKEDGRELKIESKNFSRVWTLAEHTIVKEAEMKDGRLTITLKEDLPPEKEATVIELK